LRRLELEHLPGEIALEAVRARGQLGIAPQMGEVGRIDTAQADRPGAAARLVTSSADQTARIWDASSGEELVVLAGHTGSVWQATWSADESRVLTRSDDQTARIWDASSGEELVVLAGHTGSVLQATWSADESRVLTSSADQTARIWYTHMADLIEAVCQQVPRNMTQVEWNRFMAGPYQPTCPNAPLPPEVGQ
jgi:WD40 repeat protein